jgi:hypothetical protein
MGAPVGASTKSFLAPEEKVFDFGVVETKKGYEAVFSRVILTRLRLRPTSDVEWDSA